LTLLTSEGANVNMPVWEWLDFR